MTQGVRKILRDKCQLNTDFNEVLSPFITKIAHGFWSKDHIWVKAKLFFGVFRAYFTTN